MKRFEVGDLVCVHGELSESDKWIGEIAGNETAGSDIYLVKQRGRTQLTKFEYAPDELRPTLLTFEGPMCVECPPPRRKRKR